MRILVTGGAGFIASHLTEAFLHDGHEVAVLDDLSGGSRAYLPAGARFYEHDLRDAAAVDRVLRDFRPETVNHHAAQMDVRRSLDDPAHDAGVNILGGLNVLLGAVRHGAGRFVFASTGGAVYGEPASLPVPETAAVRPESAYGLTKATFESYLGLWQKLHGITPVILRYANVYGPRQGLSGEAGVVAVFARRVLAGEDCTIFGDGTAARDYVFVQDVVAANRLALHRGGGETLNIGTGVLTTTAEVFAAVRDAAREWTEEAGRIPQAHHVPARPGEIHRTCLDATRAHEVLGWMPTTGFRAGVADTVAWAQGDLLATREALVS